MDTPIPEGAIPVDQFEAADVQPSGTNVPHIEQSEANVQNEGHLPAGSIPVDQFVSHEEAYETPGQQLKAGLEGAAKGVLGPLAPFLEKKMLHVAGEDIRARAEANPITHSVGQGVGLVGSALTGVGEGAIMGKVGNAAADVAGLSAPTSLVAKVGSEAVKQAAEMAVLQSSDEAAKMVLNDPNTSSESAIANIGLAAALGGAGGAFITGAVSPLWQATAQKPIEKFLGSLKDHLEGRGAAILSEDIGQSAKAIGIDLSPELKAGLSGDLKAQTLFNELREIQHPKIMGELTSMENKANESILSTLGKSPEDIANYSQATSGKNAMESFRKEYKSKFEPISKEFDEVTKGFKEAPVFPEHMGSLADQISSMAVEKGYLGADIPQNKIVNSVLDRLSGIKTAEDFVKLNTTINNMTKGDLALSQVGRDLKSLISDAQHNTMSMTIGKEAPQLMPRYEAVRQAYADLAKVSNEMAGELGLGKFVGPKSLLMKLAEKRSPEQFLSRLSPKGNAEILQVLGKHFPETLEVIRDHELKKLLKPAVLGAKGEQLINSKILGNAIEKAMAGQPELLKFVLPPGSLEKIKAAKTVLDAIPGMKSSGTAGWQQKMMAYLPQSAMAGVSMLMGHNPIWGYMAGHVGKVLTRNIPDAAKLGLLRFMAADQPIKAEGFKAMVDFLQNSMQGQTLLTKSVGNVFKSGAQVLTDSQMPNKADRIKLDKIIEDYQKSPELMLRLTNGQTGHYLPNHQSALTSSTTNAVNYLQSIKPKPYQAGPLDKPIDPRPDQIARYNRALDIANQPAVVLQHVKNGTVQLSDLVDLKSMYPAVYSDMAKKISNEMMNKASDMQHIPYKTRMGISLFLGQPVDSSMDPMAIQSAQQRSPNGQQQPQQQQGSSPKGKPSALGKINKNYMTPSQSREQSRQKD